jgi:hypothetical protein
MPILKWPEFQIIHLWILVGFLIFVSLISFVTFYFINLKQKIYLLFLTIAKQKNFSLKELDLFKSFYNYYLKNYSIFTIKKEIHDPHILKKRLFEWYFKTIKNDQQGNFLFLKILHHLFFEHTTFNITSVKELENNEPILIFIKDIFYLGFIKEVTEKPIPKIKIQTIADLILQDYKRKNVEIIFYRPISGNYKTKGKITNIEKNQLEIIIESEIEPLTFNLMTLKKVFGNITLKHKTLNFQTEKIPFISEKLSIHGIKIYPVINLREFLLNFLKEYNIPNIIWEDFEVDIEIELENEPYYLKGIIKDIYKTEKNRYLVLFVYQENQKNLQKIFIYFIKKNFPVPEKL